ncbi:MAG: hypothetical protein ACPL88_09510, partial [Bryobacteraceae bacterium]
PAWMRAAGKPLLVGLEFATPAGMVERTWEIMQGPAQGLILSPPEGPPSEASRLLEALHAIVHQDVALEEARQIAGLPDA